MKSFGLGWVCALLWAVAAWPEDPPPAPLLLRDAVRAALDRLYASGRAAENVETQPLSADQRFDAYLRAALVPGPEDEAVEDAKTRVRGGLIALALFLDYTGSFAANPLAGGAFAALETAAERAEKDQVRGKPEIRGRRDWALHFALSAAGACQAPGEFVSRMGLEKELSDARRKEGGDGSGFSFGDLGANQAGIAFAQDLLRGNERARALLERVAVGAGGADFCPELKDLPEGLTLAEFKARYGGPEDERCRAVVREIGRRIDRCEGYR